MIACPSELDWIFLEIGTLPCSSGRQKGSCVPLVSEDAELHAKSGGFQHSFDCKGLRDPLQY